MDLWTLQCTADVVQRISLGVDDNSRVVGVNSHAKVVKSDRPHDLRRSTGAFENFFTLLIILRIDTVAVFLKSENCIFTITVVFLHFNFMLHRNKVDNFLTDKNSHISYLL